uniref:Uncharacterized protein n=1 Tax=Magallana gigas TaxID=29159 RepID=K1R729_MAGGI
MEFKMISDYSLNSNNFDLLLLLCVGKLTEVFSRHLDAVDDDRAINIVDFGTNDGRNIFPFLKIMIEQIRCRSTKRDINVVLNDLPTNDFNELAKNAEAFQKDMNDQCLYVMINPGNAYRRCLPRSSIDLGTCTFILQWVSRSVKLKNQLLYFPDHMEELQNTTIPLYHFRSETDIKAPFKEIDKEIDVKLLDLSTRKLRHYENKDIVDCVRSWMYHSMMDGLCQTRNNEEANDICESFFDDLKVHLSDRKWLDFEIKYASHESFEHHAYTIDSIFDNKNLHDFRHGTFSRHLDALDDDTTVTIVDFGTNDGRNIFPFMKIMIEQIRRRLKTCDINIVLNDQPTNDFNELAKNAEAFQREMNDQCLHVMINPGNAYRRCLPRSSIDLGTCTLMVQWLSTSVKLKNLLLYSPDHMKIILLWDMELTFKYYEGGRYGTDTCTAQYLHNA